MDNSLIAPTALTTHEPAPLTSTVLKPEADIGLWVAQQRLEQRRLKYAMVYGQPELHRRISNAARYGDALLVEAAIGPHRAAQLAKCGSDALVLEIAGDDGWYHQVMRDDNASLPSTTKLLPFLSREGRSRARVYDGPGFIVSTDTALQLLWSWCKKGILPEGWMRVPRPDDPRLRVCGPGSH